MYRRPLHTSRCCRRCRRRGRRGMLCRRCTRPCVRWEATGCRVAALVVWVAVMVSVAIGRCCCTHRLICIAAALYTFASPSSPPPSRRCVRWQQLSVVVAAAAGKRCARECSCARVPRQLCHHGHAVWCLCGPLSPRYFLLALARCFPGLPQSRRVLGRWLDTADVTRGHLGARPGTRSQPPSPMHRVSRTSLSRVILYSLAILTRPS